MNHICRWTTLLVEDQSIFRELLGCYMKRDRHFEIVGEADNAAKALTNWRRLRPHLMVIDLKLPDLSGIELVALLRAHHCESRLLAVTGLASGRAVVQACNAGFHGYVLKSDPFPELIAAMRCVAEGGTYFSRHVQSLRLQHLQESRAHVHRLSDREEQVLRLAASGKKNRAIAIELYLSVRTVESHRYNLMHKLDLPDSASLVAYARRHGFLEG